MSHSFNLANPKKPSKSQENQDEQVSYDADESNLQAVTDIIERFLEPRGLYFIADGSLAIKQREEGIILDPPTYEEIFDDLTLLFPGAKPRELRAAYNRVRRSHVARRKSALIERLMQPMPATNALIDLASVLFEGDPVVNAAVLGGFIWSTKSKMLGRPVHDHIMPVLVSKMQGAGKTEFVSAFVAPLEEMAVGPVLISDIADRRSVDIFRHHVLIVDDMEKVTAAAVPILKAVLTGSKLRRRKLGSNGDVGAVQKSMLIGTANESVVDLIPDSSGHRRFYELVFRNGNPATGGDVAVWQAVQSASYLQIWQEVNVFGPSPVDAVRERVFGFASRQQHKSRVHAWALAIDPAAPWVDNLITEAKGVFARDLYDRYCEDCGDATMTEKEFGTKMREATKDPKVIFAWPKRAASGMVYSPRF